MMQPVSFNTKHLHLELISQYKEHPLRCENAGEITVFDGEYLHFFVFKVIECFGYGGVKLLVE